MRVQYSRGFTIVEIAVSIIIMAILVGLVMFSVDAATNNARKSTLESDLLQSAAALEKDKYDNGAYPQNMAGAVDLIKSSDGVQMSYVSRNSRQSYCLQGTIDGMVYHILPNRTKAIDGGC